jgi:hypothetical protein
MNIQQSILIRRLKQQPKQSMGLLEDFENLFSTVGIAGKAIAGLIVDIGKLDDALLNTNRGIGKIVAINQELSKSYLEAAKSSLYLEARNKDINKSFGVNSKVAARLSTTFQKLSTSIGATGEQTIQYGINIQKIIPLIDATTAAENSYYKSLASIQRVLVTNNGLTAEQAESYSYAAMQGGKSADAQLAYNKILATAVDPSGNMGAFKQILEGIADATADVQIGFSKMPGNLELAVLKTKKMGFAMAQLKATGDSLLDIESSIANEIGYQLVSGNRLVGAKDAIAGLAGKSLTSEYRTAFLAKDNNKQADILYTILQQEGSQLETNLIARQELSKVLGMDEAALSRAVQKNTLLGKLGAGEELFGKSGTALIAEASKLAGGNKEMQAAVAELTQLESESNTRTTDSILEEILTATRERSIGGALANQETNVSGTRTKLTKGARGVSLANLESQAETIGKLSLGAITANILTVANLENATLNAKSVELTNLGAESVVGAQDLVSMPGGGGRTLTGDFGAFSLDDRDMIMAGDPTKMIGGGGGNIDIAQLSRVFTQVGSAIVAAINSQTQQTKADNLFAPGLNNATWG